MKMLLLLVEIHHAEPPKPLNEYYTSQHCQSLSEKFQQFKQSQEKASGFCAVKFDSDGNANVMSLELGLKVCVLRYLFKQFII